LDTAIAGVIIGAVLLILGRKLFWFFAGTAGFLIGAAIAGRLAHGSDLVKLLVALLAGLIGALLAVIFYRVAIGVAGFVIGGYVALQIVRHFALSVAPSLAWVPYVIGGAVGTVLILLLLEWALMIVLSSLAGASLVVQAIPLEQPTASLIFFLLAIAGILIQAALLHGFHKRCA